ncbi:hypothetical protein ACVMIH_002431 [Bradyrhizobium sp. USDA 4503]
MIMTSPTEPQPKIPFKPVYPPLTRAAVQKLFPGAALEVIDPLAEVWDEVVHRIVSEVMDLAGTDAEPLHINLREEMVLELAKLSLWIGHRVAEKRLSNRDPTVVDIEREREECLGPQGAAAISGTAQLAYEHVWRKRVVERWRPKSKKALEREATPRIGKLAVKRVEKNHFIPRSFIRDYWAIDGQVLRWRRVNDGWSSASRSFGKWGYQSNLYSDRLEAYFGLLEGDAKTPIQMLLEWKPLNEPQRNALVGFLIIQILRNPTFIKGLHHTLSTERIELGHIDREMMRKAYETLYSNNDIYHQLAHPVTWSRWALVKASLPLFVLPDTFCVYRDLGDGLRLITPLTPRVCFVTLPGREAQKRIVPLQLCADELLARRISGLLIKHAEKEFISHAEFRFDEQIMEGGSFDEILREVEFAIRD